MLYNHSATVIHATGLAAAVALAGIAPAMLPGPARVAAVVLVGGLALGGLLGRRPVLALAGSVAAMLLFAAALLLDRGPPSADSLAAGFVLGAAALALIEASWFGARFAAGGQDPQVGWAMLAQLARTLALAAALGIAAVATVPALPDRSGLWRPVLLLAGVLVSLAAVVLALTDRRA